MNRIATLASVLALAATASCSKESPTPRTSTTDSPTDRATPPEPEITPDENDQRFVHTSYPDEAVTEKGSLGKARNGGLIAATGEKSYELAKAWESGPAIIVFYRGHW